VHRGELEDLDSLRSGAAASDGVIHTASLSVSDPARIAQTGLRAIEALGAALAGSGRPLVVTSAIALLEPARLVTEEDAPSPDSAMGAFGIALEEAALVSRGVRVSVVRLPFSVHGEGDHGFIPALISIARAKGVSAYPGDGSQRWPAVHRLDAAHLFRLALESAKAGSRLHGVADQGVPVREIAGVTGRRLGVPVVSLPGEEAGDHFGFLGHFFSMDYSASSTLTQQRLGWHPVQPALLADLDQEYYFKNER
jgi:nucleoside-diphosphate-sugar epimerase